MVLATATARVSDPALRSALRAAGGSFMSTTTITTITTGTGPVRSVVFA